MSIRRPEQVTFQRRHLWARLNYSMTSVGALNVMDRRVSRFTLAERGAPIRQQHIACKKGSCRNVEPEWCFQLQCRDSLVIGTRGVRDNGRQFEILAREVC